jgi:hypothetical protein
MLSQLVVFGLVLVRPIRPLHPAIDVEVEFRQTCILESFGKLPGESHPVREQDRFDPLLCYVLDHFHHVRIEQRFPTCYRDAIAIRESPDGVDLFL